MMKLQILILLMDKPKLVRIIMVVYVQAQLMMMDIVLGLENFVFLVREISLQGML